MLNGNDDLSSFFFEYNFFYFMGKIWGIKEKVNFLIFKYVDLYKVKRLSGI